MANHTDLGVYGEELVVSMFKDAGIEAERAKPADIIIEGGIAIEVKTATISNYNGKRLGYQFCLEREGHTKVKGVAVVLICVDGQGEAHFFIVPASLVEGRKKLVITNHKPETYNGMWAAWKDRWDAIAQAA